MRKMKMMMLALMGAATMSGCKEQVPQQLQQAQTTKDAAKREMAQSADDILDPTNGLNPFEHFGMEHNKRLTAIDQLIQDGGDDSRDAIRAHNLALVKANRGIDFSKQLDQLEKAFKTYEYDKEFVFGQMEPQGAEYLRRLIDKVAPLESVDTYKRFIADVKQLEEQILEDKSLSERDRNVLLVATSIGRHSAYWWQDRIRTEIKQEDGRGFFNRFLQLHAYVNGDLIAGAIGMFTESSMEDVVDGAAGISSYFRWYVANNW